LHNNRTETQAFAPQGADGFSADGLCFAFCKGSHADYISIIYSWQEAIRENICKLLEADPSVVNIKAKTHEKVDSLGENRSIACHAVVMLIRKDMA